jgi:hypothetical protein
MSEIEQDESLKKGHRDNCLLRVIIIIVIASEHAAEFVVGMYPLIVAASFNILLKQVSWVTTPAFT